MDPIDRLQSILRILFYIFGLAAVVGFFLDDFTSYHNVWWLYCGVGAILCSIIRFFMRMM